MLVATFEARGLELGLTHASSFGCTVATLRAEANFDRRRTTGAEAPGAGFSDVEAQVMSTLLITTGSFGRSFIPVGCAEIASTTSRPA